MESENIAQANLETFRVYYPGLFKLDSDQQLVPEWIHDLFTSAAREMEIRALFEGCYLLELSIEAGLLPSDIRTYGELMFSSEALRNSEEVAGVRFPGRGALRPLLLRLADRLDGIELPPIRADAVMAYYLHQRLVQVRVFSRQPGIPQVLNILAGGEAEVTTSMFRPEPEGAEYRRFHLTLGFLRENLVALVLENPDAANLPIDVSLGLLQTLTDVKDLLRITDEIVSIHPVESAVEERVPDSVASARLMNPDTWRNLVRWSVFNNRDQSIADSLGALDIELEQLGRRQLFLDRRRRSAFRRDNVG